MQNGLQTVLVSGPAGLGKTALLHRTASELDSFTVLWAIGDSWESEVPYGVVSQLVSPARPQYRTEYPLLFGPGGEDVSPHQVGTELLDLVGQLTARRPVAMIVDDLPAADPNSLRALAFALRRLRDARVMLIAAARPSGRDTGLIMSPVSGSVVSGSVVSGSVVSGSVVSGSVASGSVASGRDDWRQMLPVETDEIQLSELSSDEVMWLARIHGIPWLPPKRLDWLTRYTGGHPLYLQELLDGVDGARLLADTGGGITAPRSVVMAISRQVHTLPPSSVLLLEALAVLDGRYPLAVVAKLAGVEHPDEAVVPLLAENLVRCWPHMPSTPICIRYPIQRDAVYELIAPNRRRALHAAALGWSHGRAAWVHKVAASDRIDARLAADLEAAAQSVLLEGQPARAATFLLWAADLSGLPSDRERRILRATAHLLWNYRFSRAEPLFAEVENATDSPLRSCLLGRYSAMRGWFSAAEAAFRGALADPGDTWVGMLAATGLASLYCWLGRGADAAVSAQQALAGEGQHPDLGRLARQQLAIATLHTAGPVAAVAEIDRRLELPERAVGARSAHADALAWRSLLRGLGGRLSAAIDDADAVIRLTETGSVGEVEVSPQYPLAWAQYLLGHWEQAEVNAEHAASLAIAEGKSWAHAYSHMIVAMVAAGRGHWDAASAAVAETDRWVRALGPPQYAVFTAMAGAALAQARGDPGGVLRALRPLTAPAQTTGWPLAYEPWWRIMAAEALIAQGELVEAQATINRLAELCSPSSQSGVGGDMPVLAPAAAWLSGSLAVARGDDGAALLILGAAVEDDAVRVEAGADGLPLYGALLQETYGRLLVRNRQWRAGFSRLQRAHQEFLTIGATPFADRCLRLLAASGVRPAPSRAGPLTLLTERERAIAELVTRGMTNHEVAARLFISAKTVSHHLGRIFTKLGIGSRRELRDLLGPDDTPDTSA